MLDGDMADGGDRRPGGSDRLQALAVAAGGR